MARSERQRGGLEVLSSVVHQRWSRRAAATVAGLALVVLQPGCLGGPDAAAPPAVIADRVFVLPASSGAPFLPVVADATVRLPLAGNQATMERLAGDLVIGTAGRGFLRRVEAVRRDSDALVIEGPDATLADVVREGELAGTLTLRDASLVPQTDGPKFSGFKFELGKTSLISDSQIDVRVARGSLALGGGVDFLVKLGWTGPTDIRLGAALGADLDLALEAHVHDQVALSQKLLQRKDNTLEIGRSPDVCQTYPVGFVPVVVCAYVEIKLNVTLKEQGTLDIDSAVSGHARLGGGVEWHGGPWRPYNSSSFSFSTSGPGISAAVGQLEVDVGVATELHVMFYGIAGPFFGGGPYAGVRATLPGGDELDVMGVAGWRLVAGGELKVLGLKAQLAYTLWNPEWTFGKQVLHLPGNGNPGNGNPGNGNPGNGNPGNGNPGNGNPGNGNPGNGNPGNGNPGNGNPGNGNPGSGGQGGPSCVNNPGVGNNCGDQHVIAGGDPAVVYHCNGAGPAAVVARCAHGCRHNPPGVDDECLPGTPTCVNNPGVGNNCGDQRVMSGGDATSLYHCNGPGPATLLRWCASGCIHNPPGIDDTCR